MREFLNIQVIESLKHRINLIEEEIGILKKEALKTNKNIIDEKLVLLLKRKNELIFQLEKLI